MAHQAEFFQGNRSRLAEAIKGGLVVVTGHEEMQRTLDQAFTFEQEANFWYLSGIDVPRWKLVYDGTRNHTWLVRPVVDEVERIFSGEVDPKELLKKSGADEIIDAADLEQLLRQLHRKHSTVYTIAPIAAERYTFVQNPAPKQLHKMLDRVFTSVIDCTKELATLRAIKQPNEIKAMKRAIDLTVDAFTLLYNSLDQCKHEYEVEAVVTHRFRQNNAYHAYDPIVAVGKNACTLHYIKNDMSLRKGQLLLCDIGATYDGYAADITRTYAYGNPTARQTAVLGVLAKAQAKIIKFIKPGVSFASYIEDSDRIIAESLREIGFTGDSDRELVSEYMPHAISHGLGIDVHDSLGGYKEFVPGMVLTVEPGIYIPRESIGARIEDDILVTERGHQNLSSKLPSNPLNGLVS